MVPADESRRAGALEAIEVAPFLHRKNENARINVRALSFEMATFSYEVPFLVTITRCSWRQKFPGLRICKVA